MNFLFTFLFLLFPIINSSETNEKIITPSPQKPSNSAFYILYQSFIFNSGWSVWSKENQINGLFNIPILTFRIISKINIKYRAYKPNFWSNWIQNGNTIFGEFEGGFLKGIQIKINENDIDNEQYIPYYRVHNPNNDKWLDWNINGESAGNLSSSFLGFDQMQILFIEKKDIYYKVKDKFNEWSDWVLNNEICGNLKDEIYGIIIHVENQNFKDLSYNVFFSNNFINCKNGEKCENKNNNNEYLKKIQMVNKQKNNFNSSFQFRIYIQNSNWTNWTSYDIELGSQNGFTAIQIKLN